MMWRKHLQIAGLLGLVVLAGCIPSVHSLYNERDVVFEPALLGEWTNESSSNTLTFTQKGAKSYNLVFRGEGGAKAEFVAHLLKVGEWHFLDFYPLESAALQNDFYKCNFLPMHTFMRVREIEPGLRLEILKTDWLLEYLANNPEAIKHEKVKDSLMLTAKPAELQAFLLKHEKTEDAWAEGSSMTRKTEKK